MNIESTMNNSDSVCVIEIGYPIESDVRGTIMDDAALFGQHDKNAHLFQSAEECTDKMYRPPELSIDQVRKLKVCITVFKVEDQYYSITADAINIIGKGSNKIDAIDGLIYLIKIAVRCGYRGIYPVSSPIAFQKSYYESFKRTFTDYNLIPFKSINDTNTKKDKGSNIMTQMHFDPETMAVILIRRMLKSLLEKYNHSCISYNNYIEWKAKGCPISSKGPFFWITLFNQDVTTCELTTLVEKSKKEKKPIIRLMGMVNVGYITTCEISKMLDLL